MSPTLTRPTTTAPPPARPPARTPAVASQRLAVHVSDVPDALLRVLTVLQRRRCRVTSVDFAAADRHRPGRLVIGVAVPPQRADCVARWVGNLVDVLAVAVVDD